MFVFQVDGPAAERFVGEDANAGQLKADNSQGRIESSVHYEHTPSKSLGFVQHENASLD